MKKIALRYVAILGGSILLFTNFIACGAQMYQVSMREDYASERTPPAANDPASPEFGIHAIGGWTRLPVAFKLSEELTPTQKAGLVKAMKTWEMAVGRRLFSFGGDDQRSGDSFRDLYSSLPDKVNGHYLDDNWGKTGKPTEVLATTIWDNDQPTTIATADIRFNSNHYMIHDSLDSETLKLTNVEAGKEIVDMESLALHELGHLLGLSHMDAASDQYSIMNPSLYIGAGLASRKLSRGDVERIQRIYGCTGKACDIDDLIMRLEQNDQESSAGELSAAAGQSNQEASEQVSKY